MRKCVWDCLHKCVYGLSQSRFAGNVPSQLGQLEISLCMQKRRLHCVISSHHYLWVAVSCLWVSYHVLLCLKACRCTTFAAPKYAIIPFKYFTYMPPSNSPFCRIHSATIFFLLLPVIYNKLQFDMREVFWGQCLQSIINKTELSLHPISNICHGISKCAINYRILCAWNDKMRHIRLLWMLQSQKHNYVFYFNGKCHCCRKKAPFNQNNFSMF